MNNIESLNLESIINGTGVGYVSGQPALLTNGLTTASSSSSLMLSSSTSDSLLSSSTFDELSAAATSFAHQLNGSGHLNQCGQGHGLGHGHHQQGHHDLSHQLLTTSTSSNQHYTGQTISTTSSSFNLDHFDTIDAAAGCQLLSSYSIIKDEDYGGLLDDEDLVGSLMMSGGDQGSNSMTDGLTTAQYSSLLEDCLEHIVTSSDGGLVGSMCSSSGGGTTMATTNSTLNALSHNQATTSSHHHLNHVQHHHQAEPTLNNLGQHSQHHSESHNAAHHDPYGIQQHQTHPQLHHHHQQYETLNFSDLGDLSDSLISAVVTTGSSAVGQGCGTMSNGVEQRIISTCGGEEHLLSTPILTTVTSSSAGVVVATTTTNIGGQTEGGQHQVTDQLLLLKEADDMSNASAGSSGGQISIEKSNTTRTKSSASKNLVNQHSTASTNSVSSLTSPSPANPGSTTSNNSEAASQQPPMSPGGTATAQGLKEEICRLTVCPLCDNAKSFCSSSSVTRHLRSVHKLNDLLGTRNCYCLLCARFLEDLPEFFAHLKTDHQLLQQPDPVDSLYVRHLFKSFDDFMRWKTTELEKQTGCKYERCFTNEYPRSIYFKCSAIRITRITLAGKSSTSCKEPPPVEPGSKGSPSGTSSGSEAGGEKSSSNANPNEVVLESSFDARMYPCTSSIRLLFRYTGIEAIEFPYHLGHKLESNMRDLCLSHVHTSPINRVVHLNATSTTMATIVPAAPASGQHHPTTQHIQIKSEVIPGGVVQPSQSQNSATTGQQQQSSTSTTIQQSGSSGAKTTTTNHQIVFIPTKTPTTVAKAVAMAAGGHSAEQTSSQNTGKTPLAAATPAQAKPRPARKRNRSKSANSSGSSPVKSKLKLDSTQSDSGSAKVVAQQVAPSVATSQLSATSSSTFQMATGTGVSGTTAVLPFDSSGAATSSAILTTINANNNTITLTPIKTNGAGLTPITLNGQMQPITINTAGVSGTLGTSSQLPATTSQLLKSPATNPLDTSVLIDNLASDIFLDASYDEPLVECGKTAEVKLEPVAVVAAAATTSNVPENSLATLVIKPYTTEELTAMPGIKAEDLENETKDDSLVLPPAASASAGSTGDSLGIVPLEKAMQMVQESVRPRKEHLRGRFNDLLDLCMTQADFDMVETTVEQLIRSNLIQ